MIGVEYFQLKTKIENWAYDRLKRSYGGYKQNQ